MPIVHIPPLFLHGALPSLLLALCAIHLVLNARDDWSPARTRTGTLHYPLCDALRVLQHKTAFVIEVILHPGRSMGQGRILFGVHQFGKNTECDWR